LKRLNFRQKISCAYCAYGNAVSSWVKAVMNQTETYSCAIKHSTERKGLEYQKDFLPYDKFR
jgi:hypothetical protein